MGDVTASLRGTPLPNTTFASALATTGGVPSRGGRTLSSIGWFDLGPVFLPTCRGRWRRCKRLHVRFAIHIRFGTSKAATTGGLRSCSVPCRSMLPGNRRSPWIEDYNDGFGTQI
jgi:hypothetical protein